MAGPGSIYGRARGEKLIELARSVAQGALAGDQRAMVHLFARVWLEDQGRFDDAIAMFRQVAKPGESPSQRAEGLWRAGWTQYRTASTGEGSRDVSCGGQSCTSMGSNRRPCIGRRGPMSITNMPPLGNSMLACASGMPTVTTVSWLLARLAAAGQPPPRSPTLDRPARDESDRLPQNRRPEIEN